MRLPEEVFEVRTHFSPYQLFTGAYIVAAKQYTQFRLGLDFTRMITHGEEPTFERDGMTVAVLMLNEYWALRTSYSAQQVEEMQKQFVFALGGSFAVFPVKNIEALESLKQLRSLSLQRRIPLGRRLLQTPSVPGPGLANLGRMSAVEHQEYFQVLGETLGIVGSPIEVQVRL